MKVLYIAPYKDGTGYSDAAIHYIMALDAVGIDVVPRPIKLNNLDGTKDLPERIKELESKNARGADILIQHTLPHMYDYDGHFKKNIGIFCTETTSIKPSNWPQHCNLMDEIWVACQDNKKTCIDSGIEVCTKVLPYATDCCKFGKHYDKIPQVLDLTQGDFIFYTIGEANRRKNFAAIIKAFHTEFDRHEPVSLLIKTICEPGEMDKYCADIKYGMKRYVNQDSYKSEIVLKNRFSTKGMCQVHATGDCYLSASYGEAWNYPAFDAMGFGKTPIVPANGGHIEYIRDKKEGLFVDYNNEQCFGMTKNTFIDLYTCLEDWSQIKIKSLQKQMRFVYENKDAESVKKMRIAGKKRILDFSYEKVGSLLKEAINGSSSEEY